MISEMIERKQRGYLRTWTSLLRLEPPCLFHGQNDQLDAAAGFKESGLFVAPMTMTGLLSVLSQDKSNRRLIRDQNDWGGCNYHPCRSETERQSYAPSLSERFLSQTTVKFTLHLRSLSTNLPHPRAGSATLTHIRSTQTPGSEAWGTEDAQYVVRVSISGGRIGIMVKPSLFFGSDSMEVWDWQIGNQSGVRTFQASVLKHWLMHY